MRELLIFVESYNLGDSNINDSNFDKLNDQSIPDVILVKKFYPRDSADRRRTRLWKLKHLAEESNSMNTDNK